MNAIRRGQAAPLGWLLLSGWLAWGGVAMLPRGDVAVAQEPAKPAAAPAEEPAPTQAPNTAQSPNTAQPPKTDPTQGDAAKPPSVATKSDPAKERKAAEWVLQVGGGMVVQAGNGMPQELGGPKAKLPSGDFAVLAIDVSNCPEVKDEGLAVLAGLSKLEILRLRNTLTSDAGLQPLADVISLKLLDLQGTKVGDGGMEVLAKLTKLEDINLAGTLITDAAITTISDLTEVQSINVSGTAVTSVNYLSAMEKLERLDASNTQVKTLSLASLKWLSLGGNALSDRDISQLNGLTSIEHFELWRTPVNDANISTLASLQTLKSLDISGTEVSSAGLMQLRPLAGLTSLQLAETRVGDDGIPALQSFPWLEELNLANTNITDAGVLALGNFQTRLRQLSRLYLYQTKITSRALENIASAMPGVSYLVLSGTQVGDTAVKYLRDLQSLSRLEIYDTQFTPAGVDRLRRDLPRLQVMWGR